MKRIDVIGFVLLLLVVFTTAVYFEAVVWRECRADHSFMFCWRVLSK